MGNEMTVAAQPGAIVPKGNAATMVAQTREMAEAVASMQMAKMCPRDVVAARDRILNACARPKLAEGACYTYSRGGTDVTGPSIRLAEMLAQNWGNMSFGIRELEQRNGESTCQAFAWDMETNARQEKTFQVPHIRHTRNKGDVRLTDPRDIYELVANQGARRLRACILGIIPGDIVEEAVEACDRTLTTTCAVTPDAIKGLLKFLGEYGVTKEQVEARIQCHIDAMKPAQMANMRKICVSIKDGMSKPEDWFPKTDESRPEAEPAKTGKDKLRSALKIAPGGDAREKQPKTPQEREEAEGVSAYNPAPYDAPQGAEGGNLDELPL